MELLSFAKNKALKNNYYSNDFLVIFDNYVQYFKKNNKYTVIKLKPLASWRNEGDVLCLMNELNLDYKYLPCILRFNEILNNGDLIDKVEEIYVPDLTELKRIYQTYKTKSSI